ncbi:MAG: alpha-ketoglutarate-dependent dioxygenase AlkB [Archangium sp.]|nr:alpha-ketoglutarate-dependent dioxygenase AlkB [Archangium sp.]
MRSKKSSGGAGGGRKVQGLHYDAGFLSNASRADVMSYLSTLHPIWENRFSAFRPIPAGETQRRLLRPVYWLGNWQFACLDYYRPPHVWDRAIEAEPFPRALRGLVAEMEARARGMFRGDDLPKGWHLNTCLINFYGSSLQDGKWVDTARVGEHKDFEPGPVASLSLGERALFQFVTSSKPGDRDGVVEQQWLDDGSLQIFGGDQWKKRTFHRVQRVDTKGGHHFKVNVSDFDTRRINFTFRYVPDEHVMPYRKVSPETRRDVEEYVRALAQHSAFFADALASAQPRG